uniref:4Fe-4S dicluster domain-containing protein n=1 Tax=Phenylobacterium glaciei TaxID=2803784 RepID=A0A974P443_9CAUL|nr:4Fe-4S dicluster domain-containing protein [Phenylobacterium glaciei]
MPKEFTHVGGKLTGVIFEKVVAQFDERGRRKLVASGEPDQHFECDDVLVAVGQENAFPGSSATLASTSMSGACPRSTRSPSSPPCPRCSSAATPPSGPRTSSGPWPRATMRRSPSTSSARIRTFMTGRRPAPRWSARRWASTSGATTTTSPTTCATACRWGKDESLKNVKLEVELGFDLQLGLAEAQRCLNCDVQTVFAEPICIECDACVDICPVDAITFTANGDEDDLRLRLSAPALNLTQDLYVSGDLKTGRVMVKDEDVCLHCGLCAERCPTGAWDMQQFTLEMTHAGKSHAPARGRQRLRRQVRQRQRLGLGQRQRHVRQVLPADGRAGGGPQHLPPTSRACPPGTRSASPRPATRAAAAGRHDGGHEPQTWDRDLAEIEPGGYLFYDSTKPLPPSKFREDITVVGVPLTRMCNEAYSVPRERQLFKNTIYVGALAACWTSRSASSSSCWPSSSPARSG